MRVSLRIKFTFYIGLVAIVCMVLLAVVCIEQSISYTEQLMHNRLAQFASLKSQQIERGVNNQVVTIHDAFQSTTLTANMQNLYDGNINVGDWVTEMEAFYNDAFSTTLRSTQMTAFYDISGNLLITMSNPEVPFEVLHRLEAGLPSLLPIDNGIGVKNGSILPKNETGVWNRAAAAAAATLWSQNISVSESSYHRLWGSVNFTRGPENILSWASHPAPLIDNEGVITGYSISFTQPVIHNSMKNGIQVVRALGFTTCVVSCSQYANSSSILDFDGSLITESKTAARFSIVEISQSQKWRTLFPSGFNSTADRNWHAFSDFPALLNDIHDWSQLSHHPEKQNHGGSMSASRVPGMKKSSVGFSFAKVINQEWFLLISMPQQAVRAGYRRLTKALVGIAIADLVVVCLSAFFLTRLTTSPSFHIYRGMQLNNPRESNLDQDRARPENKSEKSFLDELVEQSADRRVEQKSNYYANLCLKLFRVFRHTSPPKKTNFSTANTVSDLQSLRSETTLVERISVIEPSKNVTVKNESSQPVSGIIEDREKTAVETRVVVESSRSTIQSSDSDCIFKVPVPIKPLNRRWIVDEFDDLIAAYNVMVERLDKYGAKMNDEVKLRTKEAQESQLQAELANKAKTIFMMTITNELRTPLNGILGMAAVAYCEKKASLDSLKSMLRTIISSSEILRELLQQLLNYSTLLSGDEINYQEFTLFSLKESILDSHSSCAAVNSIKLVVNINPDGPRKYSIGGDLRKITIICDNLVSNALKFSDPEKVAERGGAKRPAKVTVEIYLRPLKLIKRYPGLRGDSATRNSTFTAISSLIPGDGKLFGGKRHSSDTQSIPYSQSTDTSSAALLEVVVSDNGVGMNCGHLKNIFEPFVQGEDTLSKGFTGTGLGLAMSKMVCESLNGDIIVYSQLNIGSVAVLRVPVTNLNASALSDSPQNDLSMMDPQRLLCFTDSRNPGVAHCVPISTQPAEEMRWRGSTEGEVQLVPLKEDLEDQPSLRSRRAKGTFVSKDVSVKETSFRSPCGSKLEAERVNSCQISAANETSDLRMETIQMLNDLAILNAHDSAGVPLSINHLHTKMPSLPTNTPPEISSQQFTNDATSLWGESSIDFKQLKVLIADDNDTVRQIMQRFLFKIGIEEVETVPDGSSAIKRIEQAIVEGYQYSIIFMDLSMPNFGGIEVTRAIRRQLGYYCPVVALTGFSDPETFRTCEEVGIKRVLVKPVNIQTLAKAVVDFADR